MEEADSEKIKILNELALRTKNCFNILPIGNLTLNEIRSLMIICKGQDEKGELLSVSEAGELLGLCRSAMSQLVARLERKGMLKRGIVVCDRRKTTIKLTQKTQNMVKQIQNERNERMKKVLTAMGEENVNLFIKLYEQYIDALEEA